MTDIIAIALNKLDTDPMNVRKTYSAESVEGLAASILANGVIQNIVVRKAPKGRFFVTAGGRRFAALKLLAERDQIGKDHPVNALVKDVDDATELSLTENVMREDMHPVDQYEAFKLLVDAGKTVADVAARFGVTEIIVRRRLALAKVSPVLLDLFRNDEMDFEQLSAFTLSDDHERQEQVWNSLGTWSRHAHHIKSSLLTDEVSSSDKRIKLVGGLDAYEQAGGAVRRDLFDEDRGGFALDVALLDNMVMERLETEAAPFRTQGWGFVEAGFERPDWIYSVPRVYPADVELSEEEQSERLQLCAEHDALVEAVDNEIADDDANRRINAINERLDILDEKQKAFTDEDKARSGVVVVIGYYGKIETMMGIVKPGEKTGDTGQVDSSDGEENDTAVEVDDSPKLKHSAALIEDLTAQKTAALRVELANNPDIALVAVVHSMLLRVAYDGYVANQTALQLTLTYDRVEGSMKQPSACLASDAFDNLRENYSHKIPVNPNDLFGWCLDQTRDELLILLAYAAAHSLNAVEKKFSDRKQLDQANELGRALNVNMGDWLETTAQTYFGHLNRPSIQAAVAEIRGSDFAAGIGGMKKAEAATYAERAVKGSGWLPPMVRIAREDDEAGIADSSDEFALAAE
ncbi:ParB/RepB/Spo0J family partition protein [Rhizobium sp.]